MSPIRSIWGGRHFQHIFFRGGYIAEKDQKQVERGLDKSGTILGVNKAEKVVKMVILAYFR